MVKRGEEAGRGEIFSVPQFLSSDKTKEYCRQWGKTGNHRNKHTNGRTHAQSYYRERHSSSPQYTVYTGLHSPGLVMLRKFRRDRAVSEGDQIREKFTRCYQKLMLLPSYILRSN